MSEPPSTCPVCTTALPPGVDRCPACGAVWGEDNRCPSCHGLAAVRRAEGGYVCVACGSPRARKPGTTVVDESRGRAAVARGAAVGLRLFGVVAIATGVLAAAGVVALFGAGVGGLLAAAAVGGVGVGVGALAMRGGTRARRGADRVEARDRERRILELAEAKGGVLTVSDVVRELGMGAQEADAALTALADGVRVSAEITPDGQLQYEFRELSSAPRGPAVRARVAELEEREFEEALAEAEAALAEREP